MAIDFSEESVASGSFVIGKKENKLLVSHLGSCVGVILIDEETKIGGMYHILIPEPVSGSESFESLNYASIGMPEFIQSFYNNGAQKGNIYAIIAGGALLGKISQRDLEMDIGGRTTEIVVNLLKKEGIPIKESITGGYFGTRLTLNLSNLEYNIESIGESTTSKREFIEKSQEIDIDTAISRIRPIPQIAFKVIRMINSSEFNMKEISAEIRNDQIISAKVIQLCNSAFSGVRRKVESIDQAIVLIGEKALIKIVLQSSVELFFQSLGKGYSLTKGGLYYHAMAAASVAEHLAKITAKTKPDIAYTAGLLHDIGKVVLDQYIAQIFPTFFDRVFNEKQSLIEAEENLIGINHTDTGARLAILWNLPEILQQSIANHHVPENAKEYQDIAHIVYLTELVLSRYFMGNEIERIDTVNFNARLERLGIKSESFTEIISSLPWKDIQSINRIMQ